MSESQYRWVKASHALEQLTDVYGNPNDLKEWLADALRDGRLAARVSQTWISEAAKISFKPPAEPSLIEENIDVPVQYWRSSKTWGLDQEKWQWPVNKAMVTIRRKPPKRRIFRGLKFLQADIDRIAKIPGSRTAGSERPGPKTAAERWGFVAAKLFEMHKRGELNTDSSANSLANRLKELTNEAFGDTYLYQFSSSFLRSL